MLQQLSNRRIVGFFLLDWLGTLALLLLASSLRSRIGDLPPPLFEILDTLRVPVGGAPGDPLFPYVFTLVAFIWPFFLATFSVYDSRRSARLRDELRNVLLAVCVSTLALAGALYLTYRSTSRVLFVMFFVLDLALLLGSRLALSSYRSLRSKRPSTERRAVLIVGAGAVGQRAARELRRYARTDVELIGYLDDDPRKQGQCFEDLPVLGTLGSGLEVVAVHEVRDAVTALPLRAHEVLEEVCRTLQRLGVQVYVIPDLFALSFPNAALEGFGGIPVINLGQPGVQGQKRLLKRAFDVAVAGAGLLLISPLLLLVALLVKLESPGPVLYRQRRVGEGGRLFEMLKFRSMRAGADTAAHRAHVTRLIEQNISPEQLGGHGSLKMEDDPRITRVGRLIRKTSLDELPQLLNVLRGEMSLVGPRPALPYEVEVYKEWHRQRFEAIPGITGLWQVRGRNRVSFDEMVRMDLEYIRCQSLWLDLQILAQTPWAVITGRGAG